MGIEHLYSCILHSVACSCKYQNAHLTVSVYIAKVFYVCSPAFSIRVGLPSNVHSRKKNSTSGKRDETSSALLPSHPIISPLPIPNPRCRNFFSPSPPPPHSAEIQAHHRRSSRTPAPTPPRLLFRFSRSSSHFAFISIFPFPARTFPIQTFSSGKIPSSHGYSAQSVDCTPPLGVVG